MGEAQFAITVRIESLTMAVKQRRRDDHRGAVVSPELQSISLAPVDFF
jgi:hypothetical protein